MVKYRKLIYSYICQFSQLARNTYKTNLITYNCYLRKAKQQQIQNQKKMLKLIFNNTIIDNNIQLLYMIRKMRLFSVDGLDFIQLRIGQLWQQLNNRHKMIAINFLIQQRRQSMFQIYQQQIYNSQQINTDQYINYLYCKSIINKKLPSSYNIQSQNKTQIWQTQLRYINKLKQQLVIKKGQDRKRSPLQIQVQSLLNSLQIQYQRQMLVKNISVDFIINNQIILQVLGSHHYTVQEKLKGYDIFRALILNKSNKFKFVHSPQFNKIKGMRNKLQYIQKVLGVSKGGSSKINWNYIDK